MAWRTGRRPLSSVADGIRLIIGAVLGVSAAASVVALRYLVAGDPWFAGTCGYVLSHGLGLVMMTPLLLAPTGPAVWDEFGLRPAQRRVDRRSSPW